MVREQGDAFVLRSVMIVFAIPNNVQHGESLNVDHA